MATRIAAPGGGNWTAGATWIGGVAPTAADDAQLTVASGAVTIDTGAVARSLDCTGYTGTLTHNASANLTLGDATAGAGNVALKLVAGMTYTLVNAVSSGIVFNSTSATQQTVTTAGKTLGTVPFQGAGSSYLLGDGLTIGAAATVTLQAGTFNTGNFACSWGLFVISGVGAKTLTLGSSAISVTGSASNTVVVTTTAPTVMANTAVLTFTGVNSDFNAAVATNWNGLSVVFSATNTGTSRFLGTSTGLNNVTLTGPATKTKVLQFFGNITATGTLTVTGNSTINRALMNTDVAGTARTVTVGTGFSFTNVDFQDITAAGAAGTWTGTSMGNALGNSNITFDAPATQTHTASAGGNWSDVTKWTSRVPLPQDAVVVDVNTTGTLTADMPRLGADITFAGFAGTASFASVANTLYGSLVLGAGMTVSGTQILTVAGRSAKTITSNGRTLTQTFVVNAPGGTYTLQDAFTDSMSVTNGNFFVSNGTFNDNGQIVTLSASNSGAVFTGGTANLTGTWNIANTTTATLVWSVTGAPTINASTVTINITAATANARTFAGGGKTYGTLTYTVAGSTGSLTITGANTFGTINFSDATNARSLLFTPATNTTVLPGGWNVNGTAGKLMTVDSATAATHTLTTSGGTNSSDYLSVKNSLAGGGAYWYAGANSVDAGGNTGWKFVNGPATISASDFFLQFTAGGGYA